VPAPFHELSWFTPLPPARNGIADYAGMLLHEAVKLTPCVCYCENPLAGAPEGVEVRDPSQAFRHLTDQSPILHQIGNNRDHVFTLDALRHFGGVTSLHDLSLLYLHELGSSRLADLCGRMQAPAPAMGAIYARHWKEAGIKTAANYVLFDMAAEVLSRSLSVIVHSQYARKKLIAVHGEAIASRIAVIPHFAKKLAVTTSRQARRELGIDPGVILILTSGFASKAKRFDWLIEALHHLRQRGRRFRWVHAGEERPAEYALTQAVHSSPGLSEHWELTGYLTDDRLDRYIAAADIVVNLRFPSVGESSGTLARAFSAGRCCIVSDTAAYAEIPRDVVVHVPVFDSVGALVRALDHLLCDKSLRDTFGGRARQYARRFLSLETIARSYVDVVAASYLDSKQRAALAAGRRKLRELETAAHPIRLDFDMDEELPDLSTSLGPGKSDFQFTLWFSSAEHFAALAVQKPALINSIVGPHVEIDNVIFVSGPGDSVRGHRRLGVRVAGRACG
jgi:glycosyltransferase involved in cell wall biosynthesis